MTTTDTATNTATKTGTTDAALATVIDQHLEAYACADVARRDALVAAAWNADGELIDPPLGGRGHAEIAALAGVVLTHYAGHRFRRTTVIDSHHGFARYGWELVGPDGTPAVAGVDVVEVDADGKLRRVVGFFGPLEAR